MYLTVVRDLKTDRRQAVFELSQKEFEEKRDELLKKNELYFKSLMKEKDLETLEGFRDELAKNYASLDEMQEDLLSVDVLKLPLLLGRRPVAIEKPVMEAYPEIVRRSDAKYNQEMTFFTKLFMKKIIEHYRLMQTLYLEDNLQWLKDFANIKIKNKKVSEDYERAMKKYEGELASYHQQKDLKKEALKNLDQELRRKDSQSINLFLEYLLSNIDLPLKDFKHTIHAKPEEDCLRIEVSLPYVENLIPIKNVRYIQSRDEIRITEFNSTELNKIYHPFIMKYIALISALIRENMDYFAYESFVINGKIEARNRPEEVITISTQTSAEHLYDPSQNIGISQWFKENDAFVGKKLSNRTALKKVY